MYDKKRLLQLSQDIGRNSSKQGISLIVNMIKSVEEQNNITKKNNNIKDKLLNYIYLASENLDIFSGYNNARIEMKELLNNVLCISKQGNEVLMMNKEVNSLSFEELKYVMSWAMRISTYNKKK